MAWRWMHDHAGLLVDDGEPVVLEHDVECHGRLGGSWRLTNQVVPGTRSEPRRGPSARLSAHLSLRPRSGSPPRRPVTTCLVSRPRRVGDIDHVALPHALARAPSPSVHGDEACVDQRARRMPRDGPLVCEPHIEAWRRRFRGRRARHADCRGVARRHPTWKTAARMPTTMAMSATLNTGHQCRSMKSTTYPWAKRSIPLDTAPPRISPSTVWRDHVVPN